VNDQSNATADDQPGAESRQKRTVDENREEMKKDDEDDEQEEEEGEIGLYIDKRKKKRHGESARERDERGEKKFE
jgi:hypothetical protein